MKVDLYSNVTNGIGAFSVSDAGVRLLVKVTQIKQVSPVMSTSTAAFLLENAIYKKNDEKPVKFDVTVDFGPNSTLYVSIKGGIFTSQMESRLYQGLLDFIQRLLATATTNTTM